MSGVQKKEIRADDDGQRVDRWFFREYPDIPKSHIFKILRKGQIRVNGKRVKPHSRLKAGDIVRIPPLDSSASAGRKKLPVSHEDKSWLYSLVLYKDKEIIALNKPAGLAVQGGSGIGRNIDAMLHVFDDEEGVTPRLVHRLDKQTSGVLVLARSAKTARFLGKVLSEQRARKTYWALTSPAPKKLKGEIDLPLGKSEGSGPGKIKNMNEDGKAALTLYQTVERLGDDYAFLSLWPKTGRMHQIRVHLAEISAPVIGDDKYGELKALDELIRLYKDHDIRNRLYLHARRFVCPHPASGNNIDVTAPLSPETRKLWDALGFDSEAPDTDIPDIHGDI